jgi:hypothetical protein
MDALSCTAIWGDNETSKREVGLINAVANLFYKAVEPPPTKLCGTEGGPSITAPRLQLRDGRYLAYCESGVPKEKARIKIVFVHGFTGSRNDTLRASEVRECISWNYNFHFRFIQPL